MSRRDHDRVRFGFEEILEGLSPGTTVTIVTFSGDVIGPAQFVSFDEKTGIVTLREAGTATPGDGTVILLLASRIESIQFP
ncbi:hypothetical protein IEO70_15025 [Bacillus sp. AGMB 02131]|uniref:Uncharacterized protein n=1 Tax=Peribacillus faecalis TaxID=2772559 RepID=A0A927HC55_9BACI|nr:hypothetical protein [Peribacillus faecalis]MBD3109659.1 hypothetical protein [Peribacillus faecalis]